jgi:hypothetical protein
LGLATNVVSVPASVFLNHQHHEVLSMIRQHVLKYSTIISLVGCIAAAVSWVDSAAGDRLFFSHTVPKTERFESHHNSDELRFQKAAEVKSKNAIDATELFLVTKRSCLTTFRNIEFPTAPLLGTAGQDGDWVLLAGVSWNKANGFGKEEPILIDTADGHGLVNWYYTVEMLFIPRDRWSIRASLAFDSADIHDTLVVPTQKLDPLHIGVAIAFDYGARKPMVLGLGYGRLPLEGRVPTTLSGSEKPDQTQSAKALSETWIVSACLNIQF